MSTGAHEWDVVVPEDGSAPLENLRLHGVVRPRQVGAFELVPAL